MNKSESLKNIAKALSDFQAEVKNPNNTANNPFFKSKYAPLNEILNDVRPLLSKYGLSIFQSPSGDGANIIVTTMLMHSSGEWIETDPLVLKADKATAQGAGSAITYARRYAVSAILGISSEDDDDGNGAEGKSLETKNPEQKQKQTATESSVLISEAQQSRIWAIAKGNKGLVASVLGSYGYSKRAEIKKSDYEKICKEIEQGAA
jgi:hypothetical protein